MGQGIVHTTSRSTGYLPNSRLAHYGNSITLFVLYLYLCLYLYRICIALFAQQRTSSLWKLYCIAMDKNELHCQLAVH